MDVGSSSPLVSMKSKKLIGSPALSDAKKTSASDSDPNLLSVKTPGKTADTPRHIRRRREAISVKDVKKEVLRLNDKGSHLPAKSFLEFESERDRQNKKKKKKSAVIPEKYEFLEKFFNSLDSSIRLLQLKRYSTTFTNISSQIERLTDRRFTFSHLAQLKFIMPEAIVVEKILQLDERTSCMKPELRIRLNAETIEMKNSSISNSKNLQLREVFHSRLLEFIKCHPEGDEVPEEALPEPFGRSKQSAKETPVHPDVTLPQTQSPAFVQLTQNSVIASHLSSSFKRRFSHVVSSNGSENMFLESKFPKGPFGDETREASHSKLHLEPSVSESCTPHQNENPSKLQDQNSVLGTPKEFASTPAKLNSATPSLRTPRRCRMSLDDDSSKTPTKLVRRPPPNRSLRFDTPVKGEKKVEEKRDQNTMHISSSSDDILDILPDSLLQSIREKERLASIAQDPSISQANWRRQMIARLPKMFDIVHFFFQSSRRSVISKEKLIHEIISSNTDIMDRREVEEQVRLLQEFAPEWIVEKNAVSGEILICINKISSPEAVRSRLSEAK